MVVQNCKKQQMFSHSCQQLCAGSPIVKELSFDLGFPKDFVL